GRPRRIRRVRWRLIALNHARRIQSDAAAVPLLVWLRGAAWRLPGGARCNSRDNTDGPPGARRCIIPGIMSLKMNGFWSTAFLVALTAGLSSQTPAKPASPAPAPQERPTFKVQVDLVTNDIIVRDEKGNFIPDLKKDEFEIFEDGVKQDISSMTVVTGGRVTNVLAPPPPPP